MDTRYLTVDLLIESEVDLTELVQYLDGNVLILYQEKIEGSFHIGLESKLMNIAGPDEDISELLDLFEKAPSHIKDLWSNCSKKVLDIGYEAGDSEETMDSSISTQALQQIVKLGCSINIRIYPYVARPENEDEIIFVDCSTRAE